jgi:hypothetical protein
MAVVKVVPGKVLGRWSFECNFCGHCGGNYADAETARTFAETHAGLDCPEHRSKP